MTARLKTEPETLRKLNAGLAGYIANDDSCHLFLADGVTVRIAAYGNSPTEDLECFSLALETLKVAPPSVAGFQAWEGKGAISVLLREEYLRPLTGDRTGVVGSNPKSQVAVRPGNVPKSALASCLVAFGLLVEGDEERLVIAADWFPLKIDTTTDEARIVAYLAESEAVPIDRYIEQHGLRP
jgi:hypothetical protein